MPADVKSPKKLRHTRAALTHKTGCTLRHPGRVVPYLRRAGRDAWLCLKHPDHVGYYRAVMASDTRRNPEAAVGSQTHDRWLTLGQMQFDYLVEHGLRPEHRMLDIGCGNLRSGWRFIGHLDTGNYYGIDISPDILMAGKKTLVALAQRHGLHARFMKDWEQRPHGQSKIRVSRSPLPPVC